MASKEAKSAQVTWSGCVMEPQQGVCAFIKNNVGQFDSLFARGHSLENASVALEEIFIRPHPVMEAFDAECLHSAARGALYLRKFVCAYLKTDLLLDLWKRRYFVFKIVACVDLTATHTGETDSIQDFYNGNRFMMDMFYRDIL